jgi:REP element-mobilizing transposase RayT
MRKTKFAKGEYYHIFNRGVDKREIFSDWEDLNRFYQSMGEFNTLEPIGSIFENSFRKDKLGNQVSKQEKLVDFVCYCLNPNHYHFILKQLVEKGIEKFMHRLGLGYVKYFNEKYKRSGVLFQCPYKAVHIDSNEYLLHLSVYVNLNNKVHKLVNQVSKSSWKEYLSNKNLFCEKETILGQFKNSEDYRKFALNSLLGIRERKELEKMLIE